MIHAKNYKKLSKSVKVTAKICRSLFSRHDVCMLDTFLSKIISMIFLWQIT